MARKDGERVRLYSRPGNDLTYRFPLIAEALARLRSRSRIIDGEAVCCDADGMPNFDRIRYRRYDASVFLYAFDLIELSGDDLRREPQGHARLSPSQRPSQPTVQRPLRRPAGGRSFPSRLQARLRGHREQAAWFALSVGAVVGLAGDEKSERARSEARGRGGLGQGEVAITAKIRGKGLPRPQKTCIGFSPIRQKERRRLRRACRRRCSWPHL